MFHIVSAMIIIYMSTIYKKIKFSKSQNLLQNVTVNPWRSRSEQCSRVKTMNNKFSCLAGIDGIIASIFARNPWDFHSSVLRRILYTTYMAGLYHGYVKNAIYDQRKVRDDWNLYKTPEPCIEEKAGGKFDF